jgi:hypothetical protein
VRYFLTNNVRGVLAAAVAPSDVEIIVTKAAAPFNMPGTSGFGLQPSVLTLVDDLVAPTKIEVITFYSVQDDGATWTILDATRGEEGTTAQSWDVGDPVFQAATAGAISLPSFLYVDWNSGYLGVQGARTLGRQCHAGAFHGGQQGGPLRVLLRRHDLLGLGQDRVRAVTPAQALKWLTEVSCELAGSLPPATRLPVLERIQVSHATLASALAPPEATHVDDPGR